MNKNNKMFLIDGIDGILMKLRRSGYSYKKITEYINENYKDKLKEPILLFNVWSYFQKHLLNEFKKVEDKRIETISRKISNTDKLDDLLSTLYAWLDEYKLSGQKLSLRDTINSLTRIHELLAKLTEGVENKQSNEALQSFLLKVQGEFASPSITKEVEYDGAGNITKAKVTKKMSLQTEEEGQKEVIVEGESTSEEVKSSSNSSSSQTASQ